MTLRQAADAVLIEIEALNLDRLHPLAIQAEHLREALYGPLDDEDAAYDGEVIDNVTYAAGYAYACGYHD